MNEQTNEYPTIPVSESSGHCVLLPVKSSILLKLDSDVAGDSWGFGNLQILHRLN